MRLNPPNTQISGPIKTRRYLAKAGAVAGIGAVIVLTTYQYMWALRRDIADVASFVTMLGCLTLSGLMVQAFMLSHCRGRSRWLPWPLHCWLCS